MSLPVEVGAVRQRIDEYGGSAFLVTVNEDGTPHVVSVVVATEGDRLTTTFGNRTTRNVERNPTVTLLWAPRPDPAYSMIVDATCTVAPEGEGAAVLEPSSAVLHRVAGAPGEGPTCVALDTAPPPA